MRTAVVLLLLVVVCHANSAHDFRNVEHNLVRRFAVRAVGDKIKSLLEDLKSMLKTGNSTLGIPPVDPLEIFHQTFDIQHEFVSAKGQVDDAIVNGLSDYTVQDADFKFSKWTVTLDLLWQAFNGQSKYDLNGVIANKVPVYGSGDVSFNADNFRFATQAKLKVDFKNKKVLVQDFNSTLISVDKVKVDITGLYNNDDFSKLLSAVISDIVPETLRDFHDEVTTEVNKILIENANAVLDQFTLDEIMKLIS